MMSISQLSNLKNLEKIINSLKKDLIFHIEVDCQTCDS